jgi:methylenetetrahydrofolate reductase (NADPH)
MLRIFQNDLSDPDHFLVTLELVPGRESSGRGVDTVMGIAKDAFSDGRVSAVSMTDNPGGNPSLSPDVLGSRIFQLGMDVIVHFTCRDMNRVGIESRALQLAMMGMKNILALSGDYSGRGFGGQGAPVFDIGSVHLQILLGMLSDRIADGGDPDEFFAGCAVSPFKQAEGECFAQYAKLCRKAAAGAKFVITQLGYDARKFEELIRIMDWHGLKLPALASIYVLTPGAARMMHNGGVPGAVVTRRLLDRIEAEWRDKADGREAAIERSARLAAVVKGLGYKGIHIGGIHRRFDAAGRILDRFEAIADQWESFLPEFDFPQPGGFYAFGAAEKAPRQSPLFGRRKPRPGVLERVHYGLHKTAHDVFFNPQHPLAPLVEKAAAAMDGPKREHALLTILEDPPKKLLLGCRRCGDCGIQHVGFLCPESGCPKHTRNGACGGSEGGRCEVFPDRPCIWQRAYQRLSHDGKADSLIHDCVPPRMWELDQTSAWLNFHRKRDHQSASTDIANRCGAGRRRVGGLNE